MNDSNKSILPKHLHAEIKSIEDFHDVPVYSITKETLDNTCLQLLKENICLSHLPEHSSKIWNTILEYHDIFTLPGDPLPLTDLIQHEIQTSDENPVHTKQYHIILPYTRKKFKKYLLKV